MTPVLYKLHAQYTVSFLQHNNICVWPGPNEDLTHSMYLVNMNEHHEGIAFTGCVLFLLKKGMNQLWGIRNEEVKVSAQEKFSDHYTADCTINHLGPGQMPKLHMR